MSSALIERLYSLLSPEWYDGLKAYIEGREITVDIHVAIEGQSDFTRKVLTTLCEVGRGETITYGELARRIGCQSASRAVGRALNVNPLPVLIPCHRVLPAAGGIGGYAWGAEIKRQLLQFEGVDVDNL